MRICLICGSEVEDAGGMDVGRVGGGYIRAVSCTRVIFTYPVAPEGRSAISLEGVVSVVSVMMSVRVSVRASVEIAHLPLDADGGG